jgi:hypothetical protein
VKPSAPDDATYKETDGWKLAEPSDALPRGAWWEIFGDPELERAGGADRATPTRI